MSHIQELDREVRRCRSQLGNLTRLGKTDEAREKRARMYRAMAERLRVEAAELDARAEAV